jgi:hypothetical protein
VCRQVLAGRAWFEASSLLTIWMGKECLVKARKSICDLRFFNFVALSFVIFKLGGVRRGDLQPIAGKTLWGMSSHLLEFRGVDLGTY